MIKSLHTLIKDIVKILSPQSQYFFTTQCGNSFHPVKRHMHAQDILPKFCSAPKYEFWYKIEFANWIAFQTAQ